MIFVQKKHHIPKLLLIAIVRKFTCVGTMATAFYNQTTLFYNQTNILFVLFLFHVNGASEFNVIAATKRHGAIATRCSSLRSTSTRYYPRRVIFENSLFFFSYSLLSRLYDPNNSCNSC